MPRIPLPPDKRRTEQVAMMLTPPEKAALMAVASGLSMSLSNAARYLFHQGLAAHHDKPFNPREGEPSNGN